ncbi:MAG: hypothetical protein M0R06_00295 [Sphaerochaeta sp.]|nr:hypothetical protein [Sphaerochaeta sp.]
MEELEYLEHGINLAFRKLEYRPTVLIVESPYHSSRISTFFHDKDSLTIIHGLLVCPVCNHVLKETKDVPADKYICNGCNTDWPIADLIEALQTSQEIRTQIEEFEDADEGYY